MKFRMDAFWCSDIRTRYVFPGIGLAAIIAGATNISEDDFYVAAQILSTQVRTLLS